MKYAANVEQQYHQQYQRIMPTDYVCVEEDTMSILTLKFVLTSPFRKQSWIESKL